MSNIVRFVSVTLLMVIGFASPSMAEKRIALVIGNSNYTRMQNLPNPANDAQLMADTLSKLGFDVISAGDVDFLGMRRAVKKFGQKLRASGKDTVGLFYYAGHGVQARGANYLVPLGSEINDEADLEIETIAASDVLAQMETAGNVLNLVILDACRNNPFKGKMRSISRGLARLNAASGSLVAFAAAPGQVAADGSGVNSPYTKALVKAMQIPGLSVEQMFKQVRISVEAQTNNQQTPWEESSLRGDFFFTPKKIDAITIARPVIEPAAQEWVNIQNAQSTAVLKAFIKRHPNSIYASYALAIIEEKAAESARRKAKEPVKEMKVASLTPPATNAFVPTPQMGKRELTTLLQQELTRVGCKPGKIDGAWGGKGRRALARFKRYAKLTFPFDDLTPQTIDAIRKNPSRVCPKSTAVKVRKARTGRNAATARKTERKPRKKLRFGNKSCRQVAIESGGNPDDWC